MSGKKSVTKGKRYERRVAVELRRVFPKAGRCLQFQRAHGAPDVRAGPLWVEVKAHQVAAVTTWKRAEKAMREAGAGAGRDIAAVVQPSGGTGPLLITLALRDFLRFAAWIPEQIQQQEGGEDHGDDDHLCNDPFCPLR